MRGGLVGERVELRSPIGGERLHGERVEPHQPDRRSGHRTDEVMERTQRRVVGTKSRSRRNGTQRDGLHRPVDVKRA